MCYQNAKMHRLLRDILEGRMLWKRIRERRRSIQLIDNLLDKKNDTDLKKELKTGAFGKQEETVINLLNEQITIRKVGYLSTKPDKH